MRFQPFGVSQAARAEVPFDESETLIHPPEMAFDRVKACHDPAVRRGRGPVGVVVRVVRLVAEQDPDQVVVRPVQRAGHRGQVVFWTRRECRACWSCRRVATDTPDAVARACCPMRRAAMRALSASATACQFSPSTRPRAVYGGTPSLFVTCQK